MKTDEHRKVLEDGQRYSDRSLLLLENYPISAFKQSSQYHINKLLNSLRELIAEKEAWEKEPVVELAWDQETQFIEVDDWDGPETDEYVQSLAGTYRRLPERGKG